MKYSIRYMISQKITVTRARILWIFLERPMVATRAVSRAKPVLSSTRVRNRPTEKLSSVMTWKRKAS